MTNNTYTEVTHTGWFSRISSAIVGMLLGLAMFLVAFPLLFWNEGRAVDRIKALDDGAAAVVSIQADQVLDKNNDLLVHLTGSTASDEELSDETFNVTSNGLKLRRNVQIYQWEEETSTQTKKKLGGSEEKVTEYKYSKSWSDDLINSSNFKRPEYQNPQNIAYQKRNFQASSVSLGAFKLSDSLIAKINNYENINVAPDSKLTLSDGANVTPYQGGYYIGNDPSQPEVGDLRITFSQVMPSVVSVVAQQSNDSFQEYTTETGSVLLLELGSVSADKMFQTAMTENTILTWALRLLGLIVMGVGLSLVLRPISVFADVVPLFGSLAQAGIGIVSLLVALVLSFITISVAWIWFRPLIGGVLLVAAFGFIWLLRNRLKSKTHQKNSNFTSAPEAGI